MLRKSPVHGNPACISDLDFYGDGINPDQRFVILIEMEKRTPWKQAAEIGSSISVELNDSTEEAISICIIQTPLQLRPGPGQLLAVTFVLK